MNKTKKVIHGAAYLLILGMLANIVNYISRLFLTKHLSPEEFGLFYAVLNFVMLALLFRNFGLGYTLVKFISEYVAKGTLAKIKTAIVSVVLIQTTFSIAICLLIFIFSKPLADAYFQSSDAEYMMYMLTVFILCSVFYGAMRSTLHGLQSMFTYATTDFTKAATYLVLLVLGFSFSGGLQVPIFAYTLLYPILIVIYIPIAFRHFDFFHYRVSATPQMVRNMVGFGAPVFLARIGEKLIGYTDTLFLTYFSTLTEVGIYNVILPSALILLAFGKSLSKVLFPISSELSANNQKERIAKALLSTYKFTFLIGAPIILLSYTYAEFLIISLFGNDYGVGVIAFKILLIGVLVYMIAMINISIFTGVGKPSIVSNIIIVSGGINILLNFLLVPKYGIVGAALATTISYILIFCISTQRIIRYLNAPIAWSFWLKLLSSAIIFLFVAHTVKNVLEINMWLKIVISGVIASLAFAIFAHISKIVTIKEIVDRTRLVSLNCR